MTERELPVFHDRLVARLQDSIVVLGGWTYCDFLGGDFERCSHIIWTYNIYTNQWRQYVTPENEKAPHDVHVDDRCVAVTIKTDIYIFALPNDDLTIGTIWKLQKDRNDGFSWSEVLVKKAPSYREDITGWEYAEKMWIFGGIGQSPANVGHLNDFVDFELDFYHSSYGINNQLLCFDPSCCEWTNLKCCGAVPSPRSECASMTIDTEAWLYGGITSTEQFHDLLKLDMNSLIWTKIPCKETIPKLKNASLFHGSTDRQQLVLNGQNVEHFLTETTITYILDLPSLSWRKYKGSYHITSEQKGISGLNCNMFIGGTGMCDEGEDYIDKCTSFLRLEPKGLQEVAMKAIYDHKATLPLQLLPNKLLSSIKD